MFGGTANRVSKGDKLSRLRTLILMYISTIGRALGHDRPVVSHVFANLFFKIAF